MKSLALALGLLAAPLALADIAPLKPEPVEPAPAPVAPVAPVAPPVVAEAQHPEGIEKTMGVISGGWEYVYAAYTVGLLGVLGFAASLFVRRPRKTAA